MKQNNKNKYKIIGWDVDTQRGFMETAQDAGYQGQLALLNNEFGPKGAMEIAPNLAKITQYLREQNIPMFASADWHNEGAKEFDDENPDFMTSFPTHCVRDTKDAQNIDVTTKLNPLNVNWDEQYDVNNLIQRIRKHDGEVVFRKDNFNVFAQEATQDEGVGNPYARMIVEALGVEKAIVYGVATNVCVNYAVQGLKELGVEVYGVEDAMQGVTPADHFAQIDAWKKQGVNVVKLEDVLKGNIR